MSFSLLAALCAVGFAGQDARPASIVPAIDEAPTKAKSYDWMARHNAVVERVMKGNADLLLIGDSITHGWGGDPFDKSSAGRTDLWEKYFARRNTVNLGFGWDRTEHVLWRLQHGELGQTSPKVAVLMIGVNNVGRDSADDIALGIREVVRTLRQRLPYTKVLLLGIFPFKQDRNAPERKKVVEVNSKIAALSKDPMVTYLDLSSKFLNPDGTLPKETFPDFLHPNHRGREIWAEAMEPTLARLMGEG
jgi:beta-glucosidase